jgi:hypothetical protein
MSVILLYPHCAVLFGALLAPDFLPLSGNNGAYGHDAPSPGHHLVFQVHGSS